MVSLLLTFAVDVRRIPSNSPVSYIQKMDDVMKPELIAILNENGPDNLSHKLFGKLVAVKPSPF